MAFPCEVYTKARSSSLLLTWLEGSEQHLSSYTTSVNDSKKKKNGSTYPIYADFWLAWSGVSQHSCCDFMNKGHVVSKRQLPMHSSPASGSPNLSALSSVAFLHLDTGVEVGMLNTSVPHRAEHLSFSVLYPVMCCSLVLSAAKICLSDQCTKK